MVATGSSDFRRHGMLLLVPNVAGALAPTQHPKLALGTPGNRTGLPTRGLGALFQHAGLRQRLSRRPQSVAAPPCPRQHEHRPGLASWYATGAD